MIPLFCIMVSVLQTTNARARDGGQLAAAVVAENGVTVAITIEREELGRAWIIGTFTPDAPEFHLYSKDLPKKGIRGLGRPTRLEIVRSKSISPDGPLVANQPVRTLREEAVGQSLPVYPDGAVMLRQAVRLLGKPSDSDARVTLSVTYMACSKTLCLPPVVGRRVEVVIPRENRN